MMNLIVALMLLGVGLYLLQLVPMDATIKRIVQILVIVLAVLYCLSALGIWHGLPALR